MSPQKMLTTDHKVVTSMSAILICQYLFYTREVTEIWGPTQKRPWKTHSMWRINRDKLFFASTPPDFYSRIAAASIQQVREVQ